MFRRKTQECFRLPSGYQAHEGPVVRSGVAHPRPDMLVDKYVCRTCGSELYALNADVEYLEAGGSVGELLGRVRRGEPL